MIDQIIEPPARYWVLVQTGAGNWVEYTGTDSVHFARAIARDLEDKGDNVCVVEKTYSVIGHEKLTKRKPQPSGLRLAVDNTKGDQAP